MAGGERGGGALRSVAGERDFKEEDAFLWLVLTHMCVAVVMGGYHGGGWSGGDREEDEAERGVGGQAVGTMAEVTGMPYYWLYGNLLCEGRQIRLPVRVLARRIASAGEPLYWAVGPKEVVFISCDEAVFVEEAVYTPMGSTMVDADGETAVPATLVRDDGESEGAGEAVVVLETDEEVEFVTTDRLRDQRVGMALCPEQKWVDGDSDR